MNGSGFGYTIIEKEERPWVLSFMMA